MSNRHTRQFHFEMLAQPVGSGTSTSLVVDVEVVGSRDAQAWLAASWKLVQWVVEVYGELGWLVTGTMMQPGLARTLRRSSERETYHGRPDREGYRGVSLSLWYFGIYPITDALVPRGLGFCDLE